MNINYVHGLSYEKPQTVMPPWLWVSIMIVGFPIVFYLPAHLALPRAGAASSGFPFSRSRIGGSGPSIRPRLAARNGENARREARPEFPLR